MGCGSERIIIAGRTLKTTMRAANDVLRMIASIFLGVVDDHFF